MQTLFLELNLTCAVANVVRITPIIARRRGIEIAEVGAGGGQGDLNQTHSLELYDEGTVQQLLMLCAKTLKAQPQLKTQVVEWFSNLIKGGRESINLDLEILRDETQNISQSEEPADEFDLDQLPIDRIVPALLRLITGKSKQKDSTKQERQIVSLPPSKRLDMYGLTAPDISIFPPLIIPRTARARPSL